MSGARLLRYISSYRHYKPYLWREIKEIRYIHVSMSKIKRWNPIEQGVIAVYDRCTYVFLSNFLVSKTCNYGEGWIYSIQYEIYNIVGHRGLAGPVIGGGWGAKFAKQLRKHRIISRFVKATVQYIPMVSKIFSLHSPLWKPQNRWLLGMCPDGVSLGV